MRAVTLGRSGREAGAAPDAAGLQVQTLPVPDALTALGSSARGLRAAEVAARRERFGANELPRPRRRRIWRRFAVVRPGESGGCYVCEPPLSLPDASAL
jgi:Cation transporter/ATPase, N-terminus